MIEIQIVKNPRERRVSLEAKGHALAAPEGQDLLCAAVSSQVLGFSRAVSAMGKERIKSGRIRVEFGDGVVDVTLATAKDYKRVEAYLAPVEAALFAYERSFPEFLRVTATKSRMAHETGC